MNTTADRAASDPAQLLDALNAVREAIDVPHAATIGDDEIRAEILDERLGHTVATLSGIFERIEDGRDPMIPWCVEHLREQLAKHPAQGYKTWRERMAELNAAKAAGEGR